MDEELGLKTISQKLVITLGADAYGPSQIKSWLQKFRNSDLSRSFKKVEELERSVSIDFRGKVC
jgi:hypothetical protein